MLLSLKWAGMGVFGLYCFCEELRVVRLFEGGDISVISVSIYTATVCAFVQAMVKLTCDHHLSSSIMFLSFLMASVVIFACDVGRRNLLGSMG